MAESNFRQMLEQHMCLPLLLGRLCLVHLVRQLPPQLHSPGAQHLPEGDLATRLQQGLVAVQDLERQRLAQLSQDGAANPHR